MKSRILLITAILVCSCTKEFRPPQTRIAGLTLNEIASLKQMYPKVTFDLSKSSRVFTFKSAIKAIDSLIATINLPKENRTGIALKKSLAAKYTLPQYPPNAPPPMETGWYDINGIPADQVGSSFHLSFHFTASSGGGGSNTDFGSIQDPRLAMVGISAFRSWSQDHWVNEGAGADGFLSYTIYGYYSANYMGIIYT